VDSLGVEEHPFRQRGFARVDVGADADVSDAFVAVHLLFTPLW
jgi:hypothetical protein